MAINSINWSAALASTAGTVSVGMCLVQKTDGTHLVATAANRASYGRSVGMAASVGDANSATVAMLEVGVVPPSITGLGAGAESWVRVSTSGALERVTPGSGDDIVGKAEADGRVHLHFGVWDDSNTVGGGRSGTVDIATDVNEVLGLRTIPLVDSAAPPIGGTQVYNAQGTPGYKAKKPVMPGHYDFADYGGVADFDFNALTGTDNLAAWNAMMATIAAESGYPETLGRHVKIIANGHFYFSDTLHFHQSVTVEGTGQGEPQSLPSLSAPGTAFVFPKNVDGLYFHSGSSTDTPAPGAPADSCILRSMAVWCKDAIADVDDVTKCGIVIRIKTTLDNVNVQNFARDGIAIIGKLSEEDIANTSGCYLSNCNASGCGRDGIHVEGGDATNTTVIGCSCLVNRRYGVYDSTTGSTYVMQHCEANGAAGLLAPPEGDGAPGIDPFGAGGHGAEYRTEGATNVSMFLGCYAEGTYPHVSEFLGQPTILGGVMGAANVAQTSTCFLLQKNTAPVLPFKYFNDKNAVTISTYWGTQGGGASLYTPDAFSWYTDEGGGARLDYSTLRYNLTTAVWELINSSANRVPIAFPTVQCAFRQSAPRFLHGILLGGDGVDDTLDISIIASGSPPSTQRDGLPLTYAAGDHVFDNAPVAGGRDGWRCLTPGTRGVLNGGTTTATTVSGNYDVTFDDYSYLSVGQWISIVGVSGPRQITAQVSNYVWTIDVDPGASVSHAAVAFVDATFEEFGQGNTITPIAVSAYDIDWSLGADFYKTLGAGAQVFTFSNTTDGAIITVEVTGAASTLTWPTVLWPGGVAPTQTAHGTDVYTFKKRGSDIYGTVSQAFA